MIGSITIAPTSRKAWLPTGDAAWPAAILVAFLMPFGVLASAVVLARRTPSAGTGASFGWGTLGYVAAGALLSLVVVLVLTK